MDPSHYRVLDQYGNVIPLMTDQKKTTFFRDTTADTCHFDIHFGELDILLYEVKYFAFLGVKLINFVGKEW